MPRAPTTEVAVQFDHPSQPPGVAHWLEFKQCVSGLRERITATPPGPWVVLTDDPYAFAVAVFALWHSGRHAISPPNSQPEALRALDSRAVGVLTDRADWFPGALPIHPLRHRSTGEPPPLAPLDRDALALELFTSGTTGAETPVTKRVRHLEDEVRELIQLWDPLASGAVFFSTASHQHLYGLLFGVLWPLAAGNAFARRHYAQPSELVPRMQHTSPCVLASVPTQLKHLLRHGGTPGLKGNCRAIFSSGSLLPAETASGFIRTLGTSPIEILGSTETGGIAWRSQTLEDARTCWTPLRGVRVHENQDGFLEVRSPFLSIETAVSGFATGDLVDMRPDGSFELKGRSGSIVKIAGRRLDLSSMTEQLVSHPTVDDAALCTLPRDKDLRVAALVVLANEERLDSQAEGQHTIVRALKSELGKTFHPVLHPRFWRVVPRIPRNSQGKVTQTAIRSMFNESGRANSPGDRPEVLHQLRGPDFLEQACRVPSDLTCFPGHFPNRPVVPAVLQVDWAMDLVSQLMGATARPQRIESLKFIAPLEPGDAFTLRVSLTGALQMTFRAWGNDGDYSRARLTLAAEHPAP